MIALALVAFHCVTRHATTEQWMTPHFGQKGRAEAEELRKQTALGHTCDLYQCLLLIGVYFATDHAMWLFGGLITFNYFLAVRVHLKMHDEPLTYGLALLTLASVTLLVWPLLGWFGQIQRTEYFFASILGGFCLPGMLFFQRKRVPMKQVPPVVLVLAVILFVLGTVGILTSRDKLDVTTATFLLGSPSAKDTARFAVFIVFLSAFINAVVAAMWPHIRGALGSSGPPR